MAKFLPRHAIKLLSLAIRSGTNRQAAALTDYRFCCNATDIESFKTAG
jgi:hypothetical protein